ncbi:2-keto-4-pentenoate hydratase [Caballeronia sp. LZ008]|jgi:2-keto-4-pentenoate hydratase|uniref:2-keto-4-pentenoate hydratase n=1 Tax=unclassified Caballeronia TaxID=2646786 RepID=UPI00202844D7|nr:MULTISPECIES: 2-keto-4-pentenoate hydratase [unclassified Caballeronia]MDR5767371.1 2-keto-4-pentenoate hydratase [Caballeronia sp. LZ028]MDR5795895.1 2-keto-4-pentenoate hydratase [Caballeronia sp. LZ008]
MSAAFDADALARLLVDARAHRAKLDALPLGARPSDADDAYAAQDATLRALNADIGGWKVGAKTHDGPIQGAPLPADGMHKTGARLSMLAFGKAGLELEVAFRIGRRFEPNSGPYSDEDVVAAIESVHAAIEVVASRFAAWPDVEKPWQLADLQNHGALIVGEGVPYDAAFPFVSPAMAFTFDGASLFDGVPANPAGDPRRLLAWTVNHSVARGLAVERGTVLTAGSYTGMAFPDVPGTAIGAIEGLPAVELHFA